MTPSSKQQAVARRQLAPFFYRGDGKTWFRVPGGLKHIDTSDGGNVWAVNVANEVYRYDGISRWQHNSGGLHHISSGYCGVWGTVNGMVFYRTLTSGDEDTAGGRWDFISRTTPYMVWIASGNGFTRSRDSVSRFFSTPFFFNDCNTQNLSQMLTIFSLGTDTVMATDRNQVYLLRKVINMFHVLRKVIIQFSKF